MSAFRILVREALLQQLLVSETLAADRIHSDRVTLIDRETEIPAVCVLVAAETAEKHTLSPLTYKLKATFALELFVRRGGVGEIVQDLADELAAQVRAAADIAFGCLSSLEDVPIEGLILLVDETGYLETQFEFDNRGQQILGGARVLYEVVWVEPAAYPLSSLELRDWLRTHVTFIAQSDPAAASLMSGFEHPQA